MTKPPSRALVTQPAQVAAAIHATSGSPPHHILLGHDAFDGAMAEPDELRKDFVAGKAVARAADIPRPSMARSICNDLPG